MKLNSYAIAAAVATALVAPAAFAATATTTMAVETNVLDSCAVDAASLTFTDIDPLANATTATDNEADVTVTCSNGTAYDLGLDAGGGLGASVAVRKMSNGAATLDYQLFSEVTHTSVWGDTVDTDTVASVGTGTVATHTVYGRVPSGQETAAIGNYTDTVNVTVTY